MTDWKSAAFNYTNKAGSDSQRLKQRGHSSHNARTVYTLVRHTRQGLRQAYLIVIEGLGGLHDSLYDLGQVPSVEQVVGFGRGGQQLLSYRPVHFNASLTDLVTQRLHHVVKVHQLEVQQTAKDALQLCIIGRGDIDQGEACLQPKNLSMCLLCQRVQLYVHLPQHVHSLDCSEPAALSVTSLNADMYTNMTHII